MRSLPFLLLLPLPAATGCKALAGHERPVYTQDFTSEQAIEEFEFTDANAWTWTAADGGCLELVRASDYQPKHRSPHSIAILKDVEVGDFVLEVDLKQTGRDYAHRDLCVFFGIQDREHFYYAHMSSAADANAHHIQIVDEAPRTPVTTVRSDGVDWGREDWRRVRVERAGGEVRVFFDDSEEPVLVGQVVKFARGRIGFGSFDDVGRVDRIRLWAD